MEGPLRLFLEECETIQVFVLPSKTNTIHRPLTHAGYTAHSRCIDIWFVYQFFFGIAPRRFWEIAAIGLAVALRCRSVQDRGC